MPGRGTVGSVLADRAGKLISEKVEGRGESWFASVEPQGSLHWGGEWSDMQGGAFHSAALPALLHTCWSEGKTSAS